MLCERVEMKSSRCFTEKGVQDFFFLEIHVMDHVKVVEIIINANYEESFSD